MKKMLTHRCGARVSLIMMIGLSLLTPAQWVRAEEELPTELREVGVTEQLDSTIDLSLLFTDENGRSVPLRRYFNGRRPVVLNLVYFRCPMLCGMVSDGLTQALRRLDWTPGQDMEVLTVSFDPKDTHPVALAKKEIVLEKYGKDAAGVGWHFLVGDENAIRRLTDQVGFRYRYDSEQQQYAHAAVTILLTGTGKVSRYLYGIEHDQKNLRLALVEAAQGKYGSTVDRLLLFCFHYDAAARSYVLYASNIMKAGGLLVLLVLGSMLGLLWRREYSGSLKIPQGVTSASGDKG